MAILSSGSFVFPHISTVFSGSKYDSAYTIGWLRDKSGIIGSLFKKIYAIKSLLY